MIEETIIICIITCASILLISPNDTERISRKINLQELVPSESIRILRKHDSDAFVQGLTYVSPYLYESTGLWGGASSVRVLSRETGETLKMTKLRQKEWFGEGLTAIPEQERLLQLTWKSRVAIYYDMNNLQEIEILNDFKTTAPKHEGWGVAYDENEKEIYVSDGTSNIYVRRLEDLNTNIRVLKTDIPYLNELEFANNELLANVWYQNQIVRLNPQTGDVIGWIRCDQLWGHQNHRHRVLNGIAWDKYERELYITGKNWTVVWVFPW